MTKKKKILLSIVLVSVLCVGIAYAYLTNTLTANVQATVVSYKPLCKRGSSPHTEICKGKCVSKGYSTNDPINYGKTFTGSSGSPVSSLSVGDVFDCDVNGDGTYNSSTERFYYLTDLETDDNVAVLVYYSTVYGGVANNTTSYLYGSSINAPTTARAQLPKTSQWKNVTLVKTTQRIRALDGSTSITFSGGSTVNFPQSFSYSGYAARLLTKEEIVAGCGIGDLTIKCQFLFERTVFSNSNNKINFIHIQNLDGSPSLMGGAIDCVSDCDISAIPTSKMSNVEPSAKPVIEVPKSRLKL